MPIVHVSDHELALLNKLRKAKGDPALLAPVNPVTDWLGRFRAIVGNDAADRDGGKWRNRLAARPMACEAVLTNLTDRLAGGQPIAKPAAYLETMWTKYVEKSP